MNNCKVVVFIKLKIKVIISMFKVLIGHCVIFGHRKTCNKGTKGSTVTGLSES